MPNRIAGILSIIAFVVSILVGAYEADNAFGTVVLRALQAMVGTFIAGYVLGMMAERMLRESVKVDGSGGVGKNLERNAQESATDSR